MYIFNSDKNHTQCKLKGLQNVKKLFSRFCSVQIEEVNITIGRAQIVKTIINHNSLQKMDTKVKKFDRLFAADSTKLMCFATYVHVKSGSHGDFLDFFQMTQIGYFLYFREKILNFFLILSSRCLLVERFIFQVINYKSSSSKS